MIQMAYPIPETEEEEVTCEMSIMIHWFFLGDTFTVIKLLLNNIEIEDSNENPITESQKVTI